VQRSFEFRNNGEKAKEDVTVNVKENYVQYHVKENEADELWVVKDYNRVRTSLIASVYTRGHSVERKPQPHQIEIGIGSVLFLSRPRSEGWPHHGRRPTFSIYFYPLLFWLTLSHRVLSTS